MVETVATDEPEPDLYGLKRARAWIDRCVTCHKPCQSLVTTQTEPTDEIFSRPLRLLDVGIKDTNFIRLVNTPELGRNCHYLALSHCWGDSSRVLKTISLNADDHYKSVPWDALSKTFQQAVIITRSLGFRYLWIDSLCIIQDSQTEFNHECARMHGIYLNCYCMIAASDAKDGDDGLLSFWHADEDSRQAPLAQKPICNAEMNRPSFCTMEAERFLTLLKPDRFGEVQNLLAGPLSTRAWALQERQLAPRILHYTNHGVIWECRVCMDIGSSSGPYYRRLIHRADQKSHDRLPTPAIRAFRLLDRQSQQDMKENMDIWLRIIEEYSCRSLTCSSDKLPALSGVAATINHIAKCDLNHQIGRYLAGMWEGDLCRQLCWFTEQHQLTGSDTTMWPPRSPNLLPSWSWASLNCPVSYSLGELFSRSAERRSSQEHRRLSKSISKNLKANPSFKIVDTKISMAGSDPFGRVLSSSLEIFGYCLDITCHHVQACAIDENHLCKDGRENGTSMQLHISFDTKPPVTLGLDLTLLYLLESRDDVYSYDFGIVLNDAGDGGFRRIGIFCRSGFSFRTRQGQLKNVTVV